jgi:hypothetical protein
LPTKTSEKARIGATGSTTTYSNPVEVLTPNTNSLSNGLVIHDNSADWPSNPATGSATSQGLAFFPRDNGGSTSIYIRGANNQSLIRHYNAGDGTSTGYMSLGLPWGFANANAGIITFKVSGTTGQSVDLMEWSNQTDFANIVGGIAKDGQLKVPAGSTSVAGYGLFGTAGIGMYFPSTSTIGWTIGSAQKMLLSATALTLPMYGTGILHSDSGGAITSSTVVNADIANSTIDLTTKVTGVLPSANVGAGRTINAQTGTTYTFVLGDASNAGGFPLVTGSNASAETFTVPPQSSVAWGTGAQIEVCQLGAGKLTLAQGSGVTISSASSNKAIGAQYVCVTLVRTASDAWLLTGNLIP